MVIPLGKLIRHLMGFVYKSLFMLESGIKPIWVFDGISPEMKKQELKRRRKIKEEAKAKANEAKDIGDNKEVLKQMSRNIKVDSKMKYDSIKLLELMGVPVMEAKSEAEAQCVHLLKKGKVSAVVSDDMDCLTFGSKNLLKGVKNNKEKIVEICLEDVLEGLELNMDEFIDFCILSGCDYVSTYKGLGPTTALKLIQEHRTLEKVVEVIKIENEKYREEKGKDRYIPPEVWDQEGSFDYVTARELFKKPDVHDIDVEIKIKPPQEEELKTFLEDKGFAADRINSIIKRLKESGKKKPQISIEAFFGKPKKIVDTKGKKKGQLKSQKKARR